METLDATICALLRGEKPRLDDSPELRRRIAVHGVGPLLWSRIAGDASMGPASLRDSLRAISLDRAVWELQHQSILREMLPVLAKQGIEPILFKGTPLAHSLYGDAALRPRGDTDLLIPPESVGLAADVLASHGFEAAAAVSGEFISYQRNFSRPGAGGHVHALDVHWKINNSQVLANLFSYEELRASAVPLPSLAPGALMPQAVDHLLLVCMHRATHIHNPYWVDGVPHYGGDRLVWLCDVDLIARTFSAADWEHFAGRALDKGLGGVCADALRDVANRLGTPVPERVTAQLRASGGAATRYLAASTLRQHWMDFAALDGGRRKLAWLRELLFPGADYMRSKYTGARSPLAWLYLRRAWSGVLRRSGIEGG